MVQITGADHSDVFVPEELDNLLQYICEYIRKEASRMEESIEIYSFFNWIWYMERGPSSAVYEFRSIINNAVMDVRDELLEVAEDFELIKGLEQANDDLVLYEPEKYSLQGLNPKHDEVMRFLESFHNRHYKAAYEAIAAMEEKEDKFPGRLSRDIVEQLGIETNERMPEFAGSEYYLFAPLAVALHLKYEFISLPGSAQYGTVVFRNRESGKQVSFHGKCGLDLEEMDEYEVGLACFIRLHRAGLQ